MKISDIFDIIQGHQITDEEIYNSQGKYPIYTGPNTIKGYWGNTIIQQEDLPCLTYATKAFDGTITIQTQLFDANNTAVLIPKPEYRDSIILEWFQYALVHYFHKVATSKDGVSYLNKEIVADIDIDMPIKEIQEEEILIYADLSRKLSCLHRIRRNIEEILHKDFLHSYRNFQATNVHVTDLLDCLSGNTGLTEEYIYQNLPTSGGIEVLSSSTKDITSMGYINENAVLPNGRKLKIYDGDSALLVARNGNAGATRYLTAGRYAMNDHAYILSVKPECKYKMDLRWFAIQYKDQFLQYASSADNATWNKTGFFEEVKVDIPSYEEQMQIVELYEKLQEKMDSILEIEKKVEHILSAEVVL